MEIYGKCLRGHVAVEPLILETVPRQKYLLENYQVCILADGMNLTAAEEECLRQFVNSGGVLISTAQSTLLDQWGRPRTDYGLADVFGASFATQRIYQGSANIGSRSKIFANPIPGSLTGAFAVTDSKKANYDAVKDVAGEVVARFGNGEPAIILNRFGNGGSVFFARNSLNSLSPDGWADLLRWGLRSVGASLPVRVANCPPEVEVVPRIQPKTGRLIIHLVNWSSEKKVSGIKLKIRSPRMGKMFYGSDRQAIAPVLKKGAAFIAVRDLGYYEMIVVEPERK